jgi:hypothetical protein
MRVAFGWRNRVASRVLARVAALCRISLATRTAARRASQATLVFFSILFLLAATERTFAQDWTLTKTANPTTYTTAGQAITYTYVITDTGGASGTLFSLIDNKVAPANISCPSNNVPPTAR